MQNLKIHVRQENGVLSLKCGKQHFAFCFEHFVFLFYDFNLNIHGFVYLEIVKYQMGLHTIVQVLAKCNVYISAIQLFYL